MANPPICSIDNCGKLAHQRGWCSMHYNRFYRHGDPMFKGKRRGEAIAFFRDVVLNYTGDDCLVWPFTKSRHGYGWIAWNGRSREVHRVACEEINGPAPTIKHHAAHTCGNGHIACCNPRHIRWATPIENASDKVIHGTVARGERQGSSKLTEANVKVIWQLRGKQPVQKTAAAFGVKARAIHRIYWRKSWKWFQPSG